MITVLYDNFMDRLYKTRGWRQKSLHNIKPNFFLAFARVEFDSDMYPSFTAA